MDMHETRFSDYWWIDIPCFMTFFFILVYGLLFNVVSVELALYTVIPKDLTVLIAPIVEEAFKFLAVLLSVPLAIIFTLVFAVGEANNYITFAINNNFDEPTFYIMRGICVGFHFVTLWCQIFCVKMYYKYDVWIYLLLAYIVAVFLHLEWNTVVGKFVYKNVLDYSTDLTNYLGL